MQSLSFFSICATVAVLVSVLLHIRKPNKIFDNAKNSFVFLVVVSFLLNVSLFLIPNFEELYFVVLSHGLSLIFVIGVILFIKNFAVCRKASTMRQIFLLLTGVLLFVLFIGNKGAFTKFSIVPIISLGVYLSTFWHFLYALKLKQQHEFVTYNYMFVASLSSLIVVILGFVMLSVIFPHQHEYTLGLASLFFVIFSYMAVMNYKFPGVVTIFRKAIHGFSVAIFVFLLLFLVDIAIGRRVVPIFHSSHLSFLAISALFITFLYTRVSNNINSVILSIFFKSKIDYNEYTSQLSRLFVKTLDLRELLDAINSNLVESFNLKRSIIFLKNTESGTFNATANFGYNYRYIRKIVFTEDNSVIKIMGEEKFLVKKHLHRTKNSLEKEAVHFMSMTESEICLPLKFSDDLLGFIAVGETYNRSFYIKEELNAFSELSRQASVALANAMAYDSLKKTYLGTVETLAYTIETKDRYTRGHSERVMKLSVEIAKEMGMQRSKIDTIRYASKLHDIGKIGVGDEILTKPGKLTDEEFEEVKKHPAIGESIVRHAKFLGKTRKAIMHHHERWDGNGYPHGLHGENIPDISRVISVADSFDAITSNRPYHKASDVNEAIREIVKNRGTQFDPEVVDAFLRICKKGVVNEIICQQDTLNLHGK